MQCFHDLLVSILLVKTLKSTFLSLQKGKSALFTISLWQETNFEGYDY
jgi:hypothetical protein